VESFFAPCPRGLESVLERELAAIGATGTQVEPGGVAFVGDLVLAMRANLESRVASRVLWRVGAGDYATADDIYAGARALPWSDWFGPERTIRVDVAAIRSPLRSLEFVTLRIKDAVCDAMRDLHGRRPSVDTSRPDVRIHAFLDARRWTMYLDTSGEALFKRGWRVSGGEAPLRENLAAGILMLTGWNAGTPLFDPMCGSGTFLVEAAHMALLRAPGLKRTFGFQKLRPFDLKAFQRAKSELQSRALAARPLAIFGGDRDDRVLELARRNLAEAGVAQAVRLQCQDALDATPPAPDGLMVMNPPYGVRLSDDAHSRALYPKLGDLLKQRFAGWRACIFTADVELPRTIHLKASRRTPLFNGAIDCRLYEYQLVAGSLRRARSVAEG
jgi:putative N6-adenine-specific DNA methylase